MNNPIYSLVIAFLVLLSSSSFAFTGIDLDAKTVNLDSSIKHGKWTLVAVWALDCIACEKQKPKLSEINTEMSNLSVVGLSVDGFDNLAQVKKRLDRKPTSFDNIVMNLDAFESHYISSIGRDYYGTPTYLLYSPDRELSVVHVGPIVFSELDTFIKDNTKVKHIAPQTDLMR